MKHYFLLALFLLNAAVTSNVHAEKADSDKPTEVVSDQMTYDDVKQVNTFVGNVVLTRGTLLMKASRVVITQTPDGYQTAVLYAGPNGLATFKQKRDGGPNLWMDGEAERIEYNSKAELIKLFSKAKMRRLEGSKPTDEVAGEFISYDTRAEFVTVNNTSGGDKPGAGRVTVVIQPRIEAKGK